MPNILPSISRELLLNSLNPHLVSQAPSMHYVCSNNKEWSMRQISDDCELITGFTQKQYLAEDVQFGSIIFESDSDYVWQTIQKALYEKIVFKIFYRINALNSQIKFVFEQGLGVFNSAGKLKELNGFVTDITDCLQLPDTIILEVIAKDCARELKNLVDNLKFSGLDTTICLSPREIEVLGYYCQGMTMKEIALKLDISARTVEGHLNHSQVKLSCHCKSELRKLFFMTNNGKKLIVEYL